jgi:hypothetical protein
MPTKAQAEEVEAFEKKMKHMKGKELIEAEATLYRMKRRAGMIPVKGSIKEANK